MRAKLSTIFFVTFAVFAAALIWRVDQIIFGDKLAWSEAQSRSQMSAVVHSLEAETQNLADLMSLSYSDIEMAKKDFSSGKPYSKFQMVAKLLPPNQREDRKDWQIVSSYFQEKSATRSWASSYIGLALKTVKESDVKSGSSNVYALMDPSRKPFLLLLHHGNGNWYAGLMGSSVFQGMMDRQKGQISSLFVVNVQGQALAHTTAEYVGSLLTEDPLVSEAMKSSVSSGSGIFKDLKGGLVQGFYEQIGVSNLYAVITTPLPMLTKNRDQVRLQLGMMGIGLCLVGIALFVFVYKPETMTSPIAQTPYQTPAPVGPQSVSAPKLGARSDYVKVASALSHELKSPLTSILGHAQLAGHNLLEPKAKEHLNRIEIEARTARDIIQKLLTFAGEDKVVLQTEGLEISVNKALKNIEGKVLSKGIKLVKNVQTVQPFTMASDLVVRALESILVNSIEAMERAPKKEMNVTLVTEGSLIFFSVSDTGEGIPAADLNRIFDPFFTSRSGGQHVGLGLSMAMGILRECHGEIRVQSEPSKGTTVSVTFSPPEMASTTKPSEVPMNLIREPAKVAVREPSSLVLRAPERPPPKIRSDEVTQDLSSHVLAGTVKDEVTMGLDAILVDRSIEALIDDKDEDPLIHKKVDEGTRDFPSSPPAEFSDEKTVDLGVNGFTSKIDKPKIDFKRKVSKSEQIEVVVRRPGAKL